MLFSRANVIIIKTIKFRCSLSVDKKGEKLRKFKVKTKESLFDKIFGGICKFFKRKPEFIDLNGNPIEKKSIIIGNHNGAGGPFHYRGFMKHRFMTWGAHPMCEGYISRWKYLYHVFYRQKLHYSKFKSFIIATLFGLIAGVVYRYAAVLPLYFDKRIMSTCRYSFECIEKDVSIFIFPENSSDGYNEKPLSFHPGFLTFSKLYYKRKGVDLPVYTLFYKKRPKQIIIGKPMYINELLKTHSEQEVLEIFRSYMNSLPEEAAIKNIEKKPDMDSVA